MIHNVCEKHFPFKRNSIDFTHQSLFPGLREYLLHLWKNLYETFWGSSLEATLAATSITHLSVHPNCWRSCCIVGNVGSRFWQGRRMCGTKKLRWFWSFSFNCPSWVWQCRFLDVHFAKCLPGICHCSFGTSQHSCFWMAHPIMSFMVAFTLSQKGTWVWFASRLPWSLQYVCWLTVWFLYPICGSQP